MKCNKCGKHFEDGNTNGLPNGVAFVMEDGRKITLCQECLITLGQLTGDEQGKFFDSFMKKN